MNESFIPSPNPPLVSVCVPTYRYGELIGRCVESVLGQTFADFELIIVDDASEDETAEVVSQYPDARLRFYQNEARLGMVGNWNKALQMGKGRYLAMLHGDDYHFPEFLTKAVAALEANPAAGFVFSAYHNVDNSGEFIEEVHPWQNSGLIPRADAFRRMLIFNPVRCPTVLVRREVYEKLGWFDPNLIFVIDWEMWLRILREYDVIYLDEVLAAYRLHPASTTNRLAKQSGAFSQDERRMLQKLFGGKASSKKERQLKKLAFRYAARRALSRRFHLLFSSENQLFLAESRLALAQEPLWSGRVAAFLSLGLLVLPSKTRLKLLKRILG